MGNIKQTVNLLESNLKNLLSNYQFLKEENELLYSKVANLENQLIKEKMHFSKLEEAHNLLKVAKTIDGSIENSKETKLKINALIREIDTCIKQLSE